MAKDSFVYEEAIKELEEIVDKLNSGNVTLDDSIKLYSRGIELANLCDKKIKEVTEKISIINRDDLTEEPFAIDEEE